jgi:hypothetical protein
MCLGPRCMERPYMVGIGTTRIKWLMFEPTVTERLVYQMTTRMLGSSEVAEDSAMGDYTLRIFRSIERRDSVARALIPWLPTPTHALRMWDAFRLWRVFSRIVSERNRTGVTPDDTVQSLIHAGASVTDIIAVSEL